MTLHLIRHAHALNRSGHDGDDRSRELSERGHLQASELATWSLFDRVTRIVSSPAVRCVDTVAPLAARLGLTVVEDHRLYEGSDAATVLDMSEEPNDVVLCSHGDLIPEALRLAGMRGAELVGRRMVDKGCTWSITFEDGRMRKAVRTPAPEGVAIS